MAFPSEHAFPPSAMSRPSHDADCEGLQPILHLHKEIALYSLEQHDLRLT